MKIQMLSPNQNAEDVTISFTLTLKQWQSVRDKLFYQFNHVMFAHLEDVRLTEMDFQKPNGETDKEQWEAYKENRNSETVIILREAWAAINDNITRLTPSIDRMVITDNDLFEKKRREYRDRWAKNAKKENL